MKAKLQIENQQATLQCVCGNTANDSGFGPCLDSRTIVEPTVDKQKQHSTSQQDKGNEERILQHIIDMLFEECTEGQCRNDGYQQLGIKTEFFEIDEFSPV